MSRRKRVVRSDSIERDREAEAWYAGEGGIGRRRERMEMAACLRCQSASVNYHPQRGWRGLGDPGRDLPLPEIELISKPVLLQLPTDVLPDLILIESNRAHTVAARPEVATPPLPQAPLSRRAGAGRRGSGADRARAQCLDSAN